MLLNVQNKLENSSKERKKWSQVSEFLSINSLKNKWWYLPSLILIFNLYSFKTFSATVHCADVMSTMIPHWMEPMDNG